MKLPARLRGTGAMFALALLGTAAFALIPPLIYLPTALAGGAPAAAQLVQQWLLLWLAVVSTMAILVALWLSARVVKPLRTLTSAAESVADGHYDAGVRAEGPSEVEELGSVFAKMAKSLQSSFAVLEAERDRLDAVLRHMADGILIVNADGTVTSANPAAAHILGLDPQAISGQRLAVVVREHEVVDLFQRCLSDVATRRDHAVNVERASPRRHLRVLATRTGEGRSAQVLLVLQDLTEVRRLETVRRDFFANVSHELRTPIAAIKAMVETLEAGAIDDPPAARDFLGRIDREIEGLTQLVQELLELSRIESGQAELNLKPMPALHLVVKAVERLHSLAERSGIDLRMDVPEDLPAVIADPERMAQVLNNVVHNAIKFTPAGGSIVISARADQGAVVFSVTDTGMGIAEDDLPRLFERFYKADKARASGGTGLGLAIAKHLVRAHGGRIWAESPGPGLGATFFFSLPLAASDVAEE